MRDSLIIVLFFAVGILLSCFDLYPSGLEQFNLSFYALCFLMFCVGISIGNNPQILLSFRRLSPKFFLPVSYTHLDVYKRQVTMYFNKMK